jgi:hypothetical protein
MKIDFYIDVYPGASSDHLMAMQNPGRKNAGVKRYRATVNIPDEAFYGVIDAQAPVEDVSEVDKDDD